MATTDKKCLICKKQILNEDFNEHFKACRKKRLELEKKKVQGTITKEEEKILTTKKKGGCGCNKKKKRG